VKLNDGPEVKDDVMKNLLRLSQLDKRNFKYITDLNSELGELFGYPLPRLPQGDEVEDGKKKVFVDFPPNLGVLFRSYLHAIYPSLTGQPDTGIKIEETLGPLRETLMTIVEQSIFQERRNGLLNLFFLSFSKLIAEIVKEFFSSGVRKPDHKFLLHPWFHSFLSSVYEGTLRRVESHAPGSASFRLGPEFNDALIQIILGDQLPLITTEYEDVHIQNLLSLTNPRFSLTLTAYKETYSILSSRIRKGIEHHEDRWLQQIQKRMNQDGPITQGDIPDLLHHIEVTRYLFMDYDEVGKKITSSKAMKNQNIVYSELGDAYLDLMQALKRNEIIQHLKKNVAILSDRQAAQAEDLYSAGSLYRFSEQGRIVNEARHVTTVFMDLRGFTKKSEEAISAGELTDELYAIFDPMTSIVMELNGKIDKFTGDGIMITFGVESRSKEDPLNALRMAIRFHETLRSLRKNGQTTFHMGISIHSGIVFVSNFFAGDDRVDNTVIGRNVNIAGRLSSAGDVEHFRKEKKEFDDLIGSLKRSLADEDEKERFLGTLHSSTTMDKTISGVSVDAKGNLFNLGIVVSQQTIQSIKQVVELQSGDDGEMGYLYYSDPVLSRQISLYYVGDTRFKGVEGSFPIYAVLL